MAPHPVPVGAVGEGRPLRVYPQGTRRSSGQSGSGRCIELLRTLRCGTGILDALVDAAVQ